jgi:hypothetical protein
MKKVCLVVLLMIMAISLTAQEKPVITVLDFNINDLNYN